MANKTEELVDIILDSYKDYDLTVRIDAQNILNKETLIQVVEELRKILFPGYFETGRIRKDYILLGNQQKKFTKYSQIIDK